METDAQVDSATDVLVADNVVHHTPGSGIRTDKSDNVDIVRNIVCVKSHTRATLREWC